MRSVISKLTKLQLDNLFEIIRTKNIKKLLLNCLKITLALFAIFIAVYYFLDKFNKYGLIVDAKILTIFILLCQFITIIFSIFAVVNNMYQSRDNEFLITLPCSANQLFISKILTIYFQELIISSIYTLPILLAVGVIGKFAFFYYLFIPVIIVILPILPIAVASLISIPLVLLIRWVKRIPVLSILGTILLFACGIVIYTYIITQFSKNFGLSNFGEQIKSMTSMNKSINNIAVSMGYYYNFALGLVNINKCYFILINLSAGLTIMILSMLVVRPFYFGTMQKSLESQISITKSTKLFNNKKPAVSLLNKEMLSIFRNNSYISQFLLFIILMPLIVVCYDYFIMQLTVSDIGKFIEFGSHILTFAIIATLSSLMSASAITREGSSFYYMKIVPINAYSQIFTKLLFNIILSSAGILITAIISLFFFSWWQVLLGTICVWLLCVSHTCYSLDLDIKNPELKWYGTEISNIETKNAQKSVIVGLLLSFLVGTYLILTVNLNQVVVWSVLLVTLLVYTIRKLYVLGVRVGYKFKEIEV